MKLKVEVALGYAGCSATDVIDVNDEELENLTPEAREAYMKEIAEDFLWGSSGLEFYWEEVAG